MTSNNNQLQEEYGVYEITGEASGGFVYRLIKGPYTDRKAAIHKANELNESEPEEFFGYVVYEYKGESWSPELSNGYLMEKDRGE